MDAGATACRDAPAPRPDVIRFGTVPVLEILWPESTELNARLRDLILARMASSQGLVDSNVGGWQSERALETWNDPAIAVLLERIRVMVRQLVTVTARDAGADHLEGWHIEAWANVNTRGDLNKSHHHAQGRVSRNLWSGIYYLGAVALAPDDALAGVTRFEDRSSVPKEILRCPDAFERELTVVPEAGLMVGFPATLRHYVTPHAGDRERITIAFNLKHHGFVIPRYPEPDPPTFLWRNLRGPMLVASRARKAARALWRRQSS